MHNVSIYSLTHRKGIFLESLFLVDIYLYRVVSGAKDRILFLQNQSQMTTDLLRVRQKELRSRSHVEIRLEHDVGHHELDVFVLSV